MEWEAFTKNPSRWRIERNGVTGGLRAVIETARSGWLLSVGRFSSIVFVI